VGGSVVGNREMFWRILRRMLLANRGRVLVIFLALAAGAAITAALLNLQVDARSRLTTDFRDFGPNIIIGPSGADSAKATMDEALFDKLPFAFEGSRLSRVAFLYSGGNARSVTSGRKTAVVIAGNRGEGLTTLVKGDWRLMAPISRGLPNCAVGAEVARKLQLAANDLLELRNVESEQCNISAVVATGGPEDEQIFVNLDVAQRLTKLPGRISLIELGFIGNADSMTRYLSKLEELFPGERIHAVRQFSEAQGKIYSKISGLLSSTVVLVLVLTTLCVMAAMTNVAMERRNDVGLMKAIGGATRRVVRLFLTEAALLGLVGGLIGAALGILLSMELGKAVFGVAARPRFIVYPIAVGLTILVAIASSFPLRRLAGVQPAAVFRGEA
jgi:putative ABC transport system permease protein